MPAPFGIGPIKSVYAYSRTPARCIRCAPLSCCEHLEIGTLYSMKYAGGIIGSWWSEQAGSHLKHATNALFQVFISALTEPVSLFSCSLSRALLASSKTSQVHRHPLTYLDCEAMLELPSQRLPWVIKSSTNEDQK